MKIKEKLIFEAFKLFCSGSYEKVTFADLEEATKLTRGGITHYFKTKESLYEAVLKKYVFIENSVTNIPSEKRNNLLGFIKVFIERSKLEKEHYKAMGVENMNIAILNFEVNMMNNDIESLKFTVNDWFDNEVEIWEGVIDNAIKNEEIKDTSKRNLAEAIIKVYLGASLLGVVKPNGIDLQNLENNLYFIYDLVKK